MPKRARSSKSKSKSRKRAKRTAVVGQSRGQTSTAMLVSPSRALGPLARKIRANLVYHADANMAIASGTGTSLIFSCNGLFDPEISGAGHQPRGFDQLMKLYDHYVVIGAKLTVLAWAKSPTEASLLCIKIQDNNVAINNRNDILESRWTRILQMGTIDSGNSCNRATMSINPNRFLGTSKPLSNPSLKGDVTSNPTEQCYFNIANINVGEDAVSTSGLRLDIRIEYDTIFFEPKNPVVS